MKTRPYVQTYHVCFGKGNVHVKTNLSQPVRELDQNQDKKILFIQSGYFPCATLRLAERKEANLPIRAWQSHLPWWQGKKGERVERPVFGELNHFGPNFMSINDCQHLSMLTIYLASPGFSFPICKIKMIIFFLDSFGHETRESESV